MPTSVYQAFLCVVPPNYQSPLFTRGGVVFKVAPSALPLTVGHGSVVVEVSLRNAFTVKPLCRGHHWDTAGCLV